MKLQAFFVALMTVGAALPYSADAAAASTVMQPRGNAETAASRSATDARWSAWYGCWRPEAVDGVAPPAHVICVVPGANEGVSIATIADGRIVSEQLVIADGVRRATDAGGCKGFESATWSADGRRVFTKSDLNCGGDVQRISTGVLALISSASYVDVQTVDVGGEKASRTVRYTALPEEEIPSIIAGRLVSEPLARESSRLRAAAPLDMSDIVEATRAVGSEATDGLLVARRAGFRLDAATLKELAESGVQPSTVDVMVALSYPEHFEVAEEGPRAGNERNPWRADRDRYASSCYDEFGFERRSSYGFGYDPYASRYSRCGYNSFYSPYGYDPYGWGYGNGRVVVVSNGSGGGAAADEQKDGALVKGKGYTRRGATTGSARPRDTTPSPSTQRGSTGSSAVGSTSTARAGAGSSGSSGSSPKAAPARTAKPKGGGL